MLSSTEYLQLLARRNGYLLRHRAQGEYLLKEDDGSDMVIKDEDGKQLEAVLPNAIFHQFQAADLVCQDESTVGNDVIYRLTAEGRVRGEE